ncbi:MAG: DUF6587 family protein [Pseudoxanthomonas sp.]
MTVSLLLQYSVITLAVIFSVWIVAKKQFPGSLRRLRVALALTLLRAGRPSWMRAIGLRVSPVNQGGDSACGGCDNCGPSTPKR